VLRRLQFPLPFVIGATASVGTVLNSPVLLGEGNSTFCRLMDRYILDSTLIDIVAPVGLVPPEVKELPLANAPEEDTSLW
jgi:hypothetical protein